MSWQEEVRTSLVGSPTLGTYNSPTVIDNLLRAVQDSFTEIDKLGIRAQVRTFANDTPGLPHSSPTTLNEDLRQQVLSKWNFQDGRPRTLAQLAQQLEENVAVLTSNISPTPPTTTPTAPYFTANHSSTTQDSNQAGYKGNVQRELASGGIKTTKDAIPMVDAPYGMGRALKFTIPSNAKRVEINRPDARTYPNQKFWFSFPFALDHDFPLNTNNWQLIAQVHGNDTTSPKFSIQVNNGELRVGDNKTVAKIQKAKRYDLLFEAHMDTGHITVYLDGVPKLVKYKCDKHNPEGYFKFGIYHNPSTPGGTLYTGPLKIGKM